VTNAFGVRTQTWSYPAAVDCLTCHTPLVNYVLGANTRQLNGNFTYPSTGNTDNQLRTLNRLGLFNPAFSEAGITNYQQLAALTNLSASLERRSRSYLDASCAQCHQPGGEGPTFDARYNTPLVSQNITNYPATFPLGYDNACILKARDVWRSVLLYRINTLNQDIQMPDFRNLIDTNAVSVITDWVNSLPGTPALAPPTIVPGGGSFNGSVSVALLPPDTNATLYYTLDGSVPTTSSAHYAGPFTVATNATVSANAFETGYVNSVALSADFTILPNVVFTAPGSFSNGVFRLQVSGSGGMTYVLLASTNLSSWVPISTSTPAASPFFLVDPAASAFPYRYYRAVQLP
jgi:hypothetical protein